MKTEMKNTLDVIHRRKVNLKTTEKIKTQMTEIKELSDSVKMAAIKCRVRLWLMLTSWYMNFALKKKL